MHKFTFSKILCEPLFPNIWISIFYVATIFNCRWFGKCGKIQDNWEKLSNKTRAEFFKLIFSVWKRIYCHLHQQNTSYTRATINTSEWVFSSKSQRTTWCHLLQLKYFILLEQSFVRWEPFKHRKQRLPLCTIFFLVQMSINTKLKIVSDCWVK